MAGKIPCFVCNTALITRAMSRLIGDHNVQKREIAINRRDAAGRPPLEILDNTRICNNCNISITTEIRVIENDPTCMRLNVLSQTSSSTCLICNSPNDIHRLSLKCRIDIFVKMNIYVPNNCLSCYHHMDVNGLLLKYLLRGLRFVNRPYILKGADLYEFLQGFREQVNYVANHKYDDETCFTDEEFQSISPINKAQYNELYTYCDPTIIDNGHRYVSKKDLLCFLCKMRQGVSDEFLKVIFNYTSRQSTSLAIATVRQSLTLRFTPENIGFGSITRQEYIANHVTEFATHLYNERPQDPKAIIYNDCTYLNIEKSSCFEVLRRSFCVHKGRHLLKPAIFVAPNGYILDIQGPHFSNAANNDANILANRLNQDEDIMRDWLEEGDIFMLDRGYRDVIPLLDRLGINYKMPSLLDRGRRQFTTEEANLSRIVTKTRFVVESRNGHLKHIFKIFANVINVAHVKNLNDFLQIGGAIINRYYGPIRLADATVDLALRMREKINDVNVVQAFVEVENMQARHGRWVLLTEGHVQLFPRLNIGNIRNIAYGVYQLNLAPSYIQDTLLRAVEEEDEEHAIQIDTNINVPSF